MAFPRPHFDTDTNGDSPVGRQGQTAFQGTACIRSPVPSPGLLLTPAHFPILVKGIRTYPREKPLSYRQLFLFPMLTSHQSCVLSVLSPTVFSPHCSLMGLSIHHWFIHSSHYELSTPHVLGTLLGLVDTVVNGTTQSLPWPQSSQGDRQKSTRTEEGEEEVDLI